MALKINNPKLIITPQDRVIRESELVWLKPYFPSTNTTAVELVFYDKAMDYVDAQWNQTSRGVIVTNIDISLDETDLFNVMHAKVAEYLLSIDSELDIDIHEFVGVTTPVEPPIEPVEPVSPEEEGNTPEEEEDGLEELLEALAEEDEIGDEVYEEEEEIVDEEEEEEEEEGDNITDN